MSLFNDLRFRLEHMQDLIASAHSSADEFLVRHHMRTAALVAAGGLCAFALFKVFENRILVFEFRVFMSRIHSGKASLQKRAIIREDLKKTRTERGSGLAVLEIGTAVGYGLDLLPQDTRLTAVEPVAEARPAFDKAFDGVRRQMGLQLERYLVQKAEDLSLLSDNSFDAVIMTYVLCSVDSIELVLKEVLRVLKPGGKLYTVDHVYHSSSFLGRGVHILMTPITFLFAGNCRWTRRPYIQACKLGFSRVERETFYMGALNIIENSMLILTK